MKKNRQVSLELVHNPKNLLSDLKILNRGLENNREQTLKILDLEDREFSYHKVLKESFQLSRLKKNLNEIFSRQPNNFEELLLTQKVGPKTIRALTLIGEIVYGAKPSYEDPARYTFAHGGKDGTPYYVDKGIYDKTIEIMERALKKSDLSLKEKTITLKKAERLFSKV